MYVIAYVHTHTEHSTKYTVSILMYYFAGQIQHIFIRLSFQRSEKHFVPV